MKKTFKSSWLTLIVTGILLILVYKSVDNLNNIFLFLGKILQVLTPCIIALLIALFAYKPAKKVENLIRKVPCRLVAKRAKVLGVLVIYVVFIAIISVAVKFIVPVLYKNIEDLIVKIPSYAERLNQLMSHVDFLPKFDLSFISEILVNYFNFERLNQYLSVITGIANSFISFFVSIIISIYIILEKDGIMLFLAKVRGRLKIGSKADIFTFYIHKIIALFRSYFAGLFLDSVLIGTISGVVFAIFGVPYAVFLGLAVAVGNLIPFFGPIVAAIITYLISMISLGPLSAIWVLVFQLIMGQIDGNLIQPKIVGSQVGISPLLVLISVTVFGGLFGPVGMILGVPVCASVKLVIDDYLSDGKIDGNYDAEQTNGLEEG